MTKPKIVFFGTGPVSLGSLEGIHNHFQIEAIITKPDRIMHGRAHDHPVKAWALGHNVPVHQVANKAELSALFAKRPFVSLVGLVVDFGIIIAGEVIDYFPRGIINSHFSLLPLLRGADPISFAILESMTETGVSLMTIVPGLDEGDLIAQEKLIIPPDITNAELTSKLTDLSTAILIRLLPIYLAGDIEPWPQDTKTPPTYSRKLTKDDGVIDWTKPAIQIEREIRTFLDWPGSRTRLFDRDVIITAAHIKTPPYRGSIAEGFDTKHPQGQPGDVLILDSSEIGVITGHQLLCIDRLKPVGKREMASADFLRGLKNNSLLSP